jgi:hypothetical protein
MPAGQNGAAAGKYFADNGGTAPGPWATTNSHTYTIDRDGYVTSFAEFTGGDPNGAGAAAVLQFVLPLASTTLIPAQYGSCRPTVNGATASASTWIIADGEAFATSVVPGGTATLTNGDLDDSNDRWRGTFRYKAF